MKKIPGMIFLITFLSFAVTPLAYSVDNNLHHYKLPHLNHFKASQKMITVFPGKKNIKTRLNYETEENFVEPIALRFKSRTRDSNIIQKWFPKFRNNFNLQQAIKAQSRKEKDTKKRSYKSIILNNYLYKRIDKKRLFDYLSKKHLEVLFPTSQFRNNDLLTNKFFHSLSFYYQNHNFFKRIRSKIKNSQFISLEEDLLPKHISPLIRSFTSFRGPNCFHASVYFHNPAFTEKPFVNVNREQKHHPQMINHDELKRIIDFYFYPVAANNLKYGDLLIFLEIPKNHPKHLPAFHFKWIKHASTYLLEGFTFSKGSKSANSVYSIKTLEREWKFWEKRIENMAVKVFRRSLKNVSKSNSRILNEWLY